MKKLIALLAVAVSAGVQGFAQELLDLAFSATPANPIPGEVVTWTAKPSGNYSGNYKFVWQSPEPELAGLYSNPRMFEQTPSISVAFGTTGRKTVSVTAYSEGLAPIERELTFRVYTGRIVTVYPKGTDTWFTGRTYPIRWETEGDVPFVTISIRDERFSSETVKGEEILASHIPNTERFDYTPRAQINGISGGDVQGFNYRIVVYGSDTNGVQFYVPAMSREKFRITRVGRVQK